MSVSLFRSNFSENRELARGNEENFFDYACRIKQLELDEAETAACYLYIKNSEKLDTPYLLAIQKIFREQLMHRMGQAAQEILCDFLDKKVSKLVRIFLKDKLVLRDRVNAKHDLAKRAKWDPHYHASSLFADYFPKAKLYLPNYEEAYIYMRAEHQSLKDRLPLIHQAMERDCFPMITEAGSSYDKWHIAHEAKKIIPIFAHKREQGPVLRHDVLGYDLCGCEKEDQYQSQKEFLESLQGDKIVRIHMGETIIPVRGRENIHSLLDEAERYYTSNKPLRIGHGTHASIEDMIRIAKKEYYIEACLSSNKRTGVLDKRSDYPLGIMLLLGVHVVIGTDGGHLYSTTLAEEYAYAVSNLRAFHDKLQCSNEFIFLPNGDPLLYQHIIPLMREDQREIGMERRKENITYRELMACLDPFVLERICPETLVSNAIALLKQCYSEGD